MKKLKFKAVILFFLCFGLSSLTKAQVVILWSELQNEWTINSGGYPSEEPSLDSLYYRIATIKLVLKQDSTYLLSYSDDNVEKGIYSVNKKKRELTLVNKETNNNLVFSVAELTPQFLVLTISEKYHWVYYLSLTSHK